MKPKAEKTEEVGIIKIQKLRAESLGAETPASEEEMLPAEGGGGTVRNFTLGFSY